jgi:hypothetical protein
MENLRKVIRQACGLDVATDVIELGSINSRFVISHILYITYFTTNKIT